MKKPNLMIEIDSQSGESSQSSVMVKQEFEDISSSDQSQQSGQSNDEIEQTGDVQQFDQLINL